MKYTWIKENTSEFAVETMCQFMQVSRSADYEWLQREPDLVMYQEKQVIRSGKQAS